MALIRKSTGLLGITAIPAKAGSDGSGSDDLPKVAVSRHSLTYLLYGAVIFALLGLMPMIASRCRGGDKGRGGKSRRSLRRQAQRVATEEEDVDMMEEAMMDDDEEGMGPPAAAHADEDDDEPEVRPRKSEKKKKKKKDRDRARV